MKSRAMNTLGVALSVFSLLALLGGHWIALQSLAWTRMLASFVQHDSVELAFKKTFDGKHPCPMCTSIRQGRAHEERSEKKALLEELRSSDLCLDSARACVPAPPLSASDAIAFVPVLHLDFIAAPATPPPRAS